MKKRADLNSLVWMVAVLIAAIMFFIILRAVMCSTNTWPFGC